MRVVFKQKFGATPRVFYYYTVNVIGETLVLKRYFADFLLGKSLLYAGKNPIFPTIPA